MKVKLIIDESEQLTLKAMLTLFNVSTFEELASKVKKEATEKLEGK